MEKIWGIEDIREVLPHRYPFLLIDKVVEFEKGQRMVAIKNVTINEEFFNGHFPGKPVMPGVLIMEAMAQAAAMMALKSDDSLKGKGTVFLVGADNFKWKRMVEPGDVLRIEINFVKQRRSLLMVHAESSVDGELVASGELSAIVSDK